MDVVRSLLAMLVLATSTSALAQYPYSYAPYSPRYPPNGSQYDPPLQRRSLASIAQSMLDAQQRDLRPRRCPAAGLVGSTRRSGARLGQPPDCHGRLEPPSKQPLWREHLNTISGGTAMPSEVVDLWVKEARIRYSQQFVLRRLRPLHADSMGQDTCCRLRRRQRSSPGDLGVQL
jgi:hypothetical protein